MIQEAHKKADNNFNDFVAQLYEQEFKKLPYEKALNLSKKINVVLPEEKEYSLAELFELKNSISENRSKKFRSENNNIVTGFSKP